MKKNLSIGLGIAGIIALVAFQWAIIIKAPQQGSFDSRASASTIVDSNTVVSTAIGDTYVSKGYPSTNYGTETRLKTEGPYRRYAYIKFDLRSYRTGQLMDFVTLKLKASEYEPHLVRVANSSNWEESQLTYSNRPELGPEAGQQTKYGDSGYVEIPLSKTVLQPYVGNFVTLVLETPLDGKDSRYYSRETGDGPKLLFKIVYPTITITSPQNNATVQPNFNINFTLQNWTVSQGGNHIRILVDKIDTGALYNATTASFTSLTPGGHTITLKLVDQNETPIGVEASVSVGVYTPQIPVSPTPTPTCTQMPTCMYSGVDTRCVVTPPAGGWCPMPTTVAPNKIQGLKIDLKYAQGLTLSWDAYPTATQYAVYRNRIGTSSPPNLTDPGTVIANVTGNSFSDMIGRTPDLFTDDAANYFYTIKALNGTTEIAKSDVAGEFDYDVVKNKILFISFPYVNLPFSNVQQLTDYLKSQGMTSSMALKWNAPTSSFRIAIWNNGQAIISGDNYTIAPNDTVVIENYTRGPDQIGSIVFTGVFPSTPQTFQLIKGINMVPILPSFKFTMASQLGYSLVPQVTKIYNTFESTSSNFPFIQYNTLRTWDGTDFPLYKGRGYFVEVTSDVVFTP